MDGCHKFGWPFEAWNIRVIAVVTVAYRLWVGFDVEWLYACDTLTGGWLCDDVAMGHVVKNVDLC